jgi:hypothetical protein
MNKKALTLDRLSTAKSDPDFQYSAVSSAPITTLSATLGPRNRGSRQLRSVR